MAEVDGVKSLSLGAIDFCFDELYLHFCGYKDLLYEEFGVAVGSIDGLTLTECMRLPNASVSGPCR